jgi:hypothetical protein
MAAATLVALAGIKRSGVDVASTTASTELPGNPIFSRQLLAAWIANPEVSSSGRHLNLDKMPVFSQISRSDAAGN